MKLQLLCFSLALGALAEEPHRRRLPPPSPPVPPGPLPPPSPGPPGPKISMGKPFTMISESLMRQAPDATVTAVKSSTGEYSWFGGSRAQDPSPQNWRVYKMVSEGGSAKASKNMGKTTLRGYPCPEGYDKTCLESAKKGHNVGIWPSNVYRINDDEILMWLHLEFRGYAWNIRAGLAYSNDGGMTFQWVGYIASPEGPCGQSLTVKQECANMGLVNYIVKDGFFQIYFQDSHKAVSATGPSQLVATARAPVADVIAAARQLKVTTWNKYYNGTWTEPALGGKFTALKLKSQGYMHGDGVYIRGIDQYAIVAQSSDRLNTKQWHYAVLIAFSGDGMNWSDWQQVYTDGTAGGVAYPSIMSYGPDNEVAGSTFAVAWTNVKKSSVKAPGEINAVNVTVYSHTVAV